MERTFITNPSWVGFLDFVLHSWTQADTLEKLDIFTPIGLREHPQENHGCKPPTTMRRHSGIGLDNLAELMSTLVSCGNSPIPVDCASTRQTASRETGAMKKTILLSSGTHGRRVTHEMYWIFPYFLFEHVVQLWVRYEHSSTNKCPGHTGYLSR